jgi:hypothetical protein
MEGRKNSSSISSFAVNSVLVGEISLAPPFIANKMSRDAVESWNFFKLFPPQWKLLLEANALTQGKSFSIHFSIADNHILRHFFTVVPLRVGGWKVRQKRRNFCSSSTAVKMCVRA